MKLPLRRFIVIAIALVWLGVFAWVILKPPPDPLVGRWTYHFLEIDLVVRADHTFQIEEKGRILHAGKWQALDLPVFERRHRNGDITYHTQTDIDRNPGLKTGATLALVPVKAYLIEDPDEPRMLIWRSTHRELQPSGKSRLWIQEHNPPPTNWWERIADAVRTWFSS